MKKNILLLVYVLIVPIIAFGVSFAIQNHFNSELREVLYQEYPDAKPNEFDSVTLKDVCENSNDSICETNRNINLLLLASVGLGGVGLILLALIWFAGKISVVNRNLMVLLFKPGLYLTLLTLIALVAIYAILAIGIIYYGESVFAHRIHVGLIFMIGLGAVSGAFAIVKNIFGIVKKAKTVVFGRAVTREQAPELWNYIDKIVDRLSAVKPEHIVVGLEPNFFVTEADVITLDGTLKGRTLYCSLSLCEILAKDEVSSIIGHELGHFIGKDTKFSEKFFPIYRGTADSINSLLSIGGDGAKYIALMPALAILSYFFDSFSVAESKLSRERELVADNVGAQVSSSRIFASALVKVHAFAACWDYLEDLATDSLKEGKCYKNTCKLFADICSSYAKPQILENIAEMHTVHPTDSHPSLGVRLQSLNVSMAEVSESALIVAPQESVLNYIPDYMELEESISYAYQSIRSHQLGLS